MKISKRLFVQTLLVFVHILTGWVTVTSLQWIYEIQITGDGSVDPIVAGIAFAVPSSLILSMFKICQLYLAEYSKTGVQLETGKKPLTEIELTGKIIEKES